MTVRNVTGVTVPSFAADPVPASIAQVSARVRAAVRTNVFAEGLNVALRGKQTPEPLRVAAPLLVRAPSRIRRARPVLRPPRTESGDRSCAFESLMGAEIEMRVEIADINLPRPANDPRALLAQTIGSSSPTHGGASSTSSSRAPTRRGQARRRTCTGQLHLGPRPRQPTGRGRRPHRRLDCSGYFSSRRSRSRGGLGPLLVGSLLLGLFLRRLRVRELEIREVTWLKSRSTSSGTAPSSTGRVR